MFVDSHCHLDFPDFAGRIDQVLADMRDHRVSHALCIGVNLEDWPGVIALAERHPELWATVGVHPDYETVIEPDVDALVTRARHPRVLAIGECGLDYYRLSGDLGWQRERFRTHIRAAIACGKPLVVHTRAAAEDTLAILKEEDAGRVGGVMHCFTETQTVAEAAMAMGFYISFSGIVTFKNAHALKDVARAVPLERMLIETDAPYLAPTPHRGKTNQPAWVSHVAEAIALLKGCTVDEVGQSTSANFMRLFGVPTGAGA